MPSRCPRLAALLLIGLAALPAFGRSAPVEPVPATYLIFEVGGGAPRPLFYREVELRSFGAEKDAPAFAGDGRYEVSLRTADGRSLYRGRVAARPAGALEGPDRDGALRRFADDGRGLLVLRLPRHAGARLELRPPSSASRVSPATFELDVLAASAAGLPLAAFADSLPVTGRAAAAGGNRADLLVMGDGFVDAGDFAAKAGAALDQFFEIEPYGRYRGYFEVATLFTPSAQAGADHPPFRADCSSFDLGCCPDAAAQTDPRAGTYVDTAFHGRFCASGAHRLLVVQAGAVFAAASAYPDWDVILVLVNDPVYGGSGGSVAVFSNSEHAVEVAQHEFGHSFADLADEYDDPYPGFPSCSDAGHGCEANVTDLAGPVKWSAWIPGGTPVPTPENSGFGQVGLFEGARYLSSGMYRPKDQDCLMHFLGRPFCEVCREAFVRGLYRGGWGEPAAGVALIEPGSERPAPGTLAASAPIDFSLDLLEPHGGGHAVEWRVDGVAQAGGAFFRFAPAASARYQVEARVRDTTDFVLPEHAAELEERRSWTVDFTGVPTPGTLSFAAAAPSAPENAGTATIRVDRVGGSTGAVAALYATQGGSAQAGVDYQAVAGQLSWPDGDATPRFFGVPLLDDSQSEESETVALALSGAGGGATLGLAAATLEIVDDEPLVCLADAHTLCLGANGRFRVRVGWRDFSPSSGQTSKFQGVAGAGQTWTIGKRDSGLFYFFDADNIELLVKVLDGCGINQRFWIFYAATTNVEFELEVVDIVTRGRKTYRNTLGQTAEPVLDTGAFALCG